MGEYTNETGFSGILIHSPKIDPDFWSGSASACTQAGPAPGQAVPQQAGTRALVSAAGTGTTSEYSIKSLRGGGIGYGSWGWAIVTGGVVGTYAGLNFPNFAQDLRNSGADSTETVGTPAMVTTKTGRVVQLWCEHTIATSVKKVCSSYTDDLITWTGADSSNILLSTSTLSAAYYGVTLDNVNCVGAFYDEEREVVQAFVRVDSPASTGFSQVWLFESSDDGATWTLVQTDTLAEVVSFTYTAKTPVIGKTGGTMVMFLPDDDGSYDGTHERITQLASSDNGRTWIALDSGLHPYYNLRLTHRDGKILLSAQSAPSDEMSMLEMPSVYVLVRDESWTDTGVGPANTHDVIFMHGKLWLFYTAPTKYKLYVYCTDASLSDWNEIGHHPLDFDSAAYNVDIEFLRVTPALGGAAASFSLKDTGVPSAQRGRMYTLRCGGWSYITLPASKPTVGAQGRIAFGSATSGSPGAYYLVDSQTWYGTLDPVTQGWTVSGTGTDASGMTAGDSPYRSVSTTAGQSRYWSISPSGDLTKGVLLYIDVQVSTGGSLSSNDSAVRVVMSDGVTEYNLSLRVTASGCELHDNIGGADASLTGVIPTARTAFILAFRQTDPGNEATATVYSVGYSAFDAYFAWAERATLVCDAKTTAPAASFKIERGVIAAGSGVSIEQKWYAFHYLMACGIPEVDDLSTGFDSSSQLYGAPMTDTFTEIRNGLTIAWSGGPAKRNETWLLSPRFNYAKEHVYPQLYPSPRTGWRATDDSTDSVLQWTLNSYDAPEGIGQASLGLYLRGINVPELTLDGYTAAGSWQNILDIDVAAGLNSLPYRVGVTGTTRAPYLTVNMSGSGGAVRFIHENEFAGGYIGIGGAHYKIDRHTSGTWSTSAGKKPCFFLSETNWSTAVATTGTCYILPPNVFAVAHGLGTTEFRRLRLTIPAGSTYEGYHKLDKLVLGPVYIFDKRYSKGRVFGSTPNTTTSTSQSGVNSYVVNGPSSRYVRFAWVDGHDTSNLYRTSVEPDYLVIEDGVTGAEDALATRGALSSDLLALNEWMNGQGWPVVYIADIEPADGTDVTTCDRDVIYGRIQGGVEVSSVMGSERADEVVNIGEMTIKEDV